MGRARRALGVFLVVAVFAAPGLPAQDPPAQTMPLAGMRLTTALGEVVLDCGSLLIAWEQAAGTEVWMYNLLLEADGRCAAQRERYTLQASGGGRLSITDAGAPVGLSLQADGPALVLLPVRTVDVTHRFRIVHLGSLRSDEGGIELTLRLDAISRVPFVTAVAFTKA